MTVILSRVPVDQRSAKQRVLYAAHFMLDREKHCIRCRVHDIAETPFIPAHFTSEKTPFQQPIVRRTKILNVNLNVVAIVGR